MGSYNVPAVSQHGTPPKEVSIMSASSPPKTSPIDVAGGGGGGGVSKFRLLILLLLTWFAFRWWLVVDVEGE